MKHIKEEIMKFGYYQVKRKLIETGSLQVSRFVRYDFTTKYEMGFNNAIQELVLDVEQQSTNTN